MDVSKYLNLGTLLDEYASGVAELLDRLRAELESGDVLRARAAEDAILLVQSLERFRAIAKERSACTTLSAGESWPAHTTDAGREGDVIAASEVWAYLTLGGWVRYTFSAPGGSMGGCAGMGGCVRGGVRQTHRPGLI